MIHFAPIIRAITDQVSFFRKVKGIHAGLDLKENKIQKGYIVKTKYLSYTSKYDWKKKKTKKPPRIKYVFACAKKTPTIVGATPYLFTIFAHLC